MSKNDIDTVEHLGQVYEAFDTIVEDRAGLGATVLDLIKMAGDDLEAKKIVYSEAAKDKALIDQREMYVLRSLGKIASPPMADMQLAALAYTSKYDSPENVEQASLRVTHYNQIIERNIMNKAPVSLPLVPVQREAPVSSSETVRLHGRTDPETGKTWYSITNPRTVEYVDRAADPIPVMSYEIVEQSEKDGEVTVVARQPSSRENTIKATFTSESRVWRISEDEKKLELILPSNSKSLLESGLLEQLNVIIDKDDEATKVAVNAAGANIPNIIESFEHPDGVNPVPLSNPKRN